jgi:hypothetical protein
MFDFSICTTVGVDPKASSSDVICNDNLPEIYDSLFVAMRDYTLDSRGDVGAWYVVFRYTQICENACILFICCQGGCHYISHLMNLP